MINMLNKMKKRLLNRIKSVAVLAVTVVSVAFTGVVTAAPPDLTAVGTVFTDAQTTADSLFALAIPVVGGIMILFIAIRLVKRFGGQV